MIFLTWPNPEQLFVAQDVIKNKDYCGADIRIIALLLTNAFTFAQTGKSGYGFSIDIGYDMNANKNNSERLEISTTARKYVTSLAKCLPC